MSAQRIANKSAAVLLLAERHREIHRSLVKHGSVRVADLARRISVSEETIRRDLRALAAAGIASTVHGGAILRSRLTDVDHVVPPIALRGNVQQHAKNEIGIAAAARVEN